VEKRGTRRGKTGHQTKKAQGAVNQLKRSIEMKKTYKNVLATGLAVIALAVLTGCPNAAGTTSAVQPEGTKVALQGTVAINGTAKVGETLSANISGLTNESGTGSYQWKANGQNISGATGSTYTLTSAENGKTITLVVSFSGNTGNITSSATAAVQPEDETKQTLLGTVSISGTAKVGETLTADLNGLTNESGTPTYVWKRGNDIISGATGSTYVLTGADSGKIITLVVSYSGNTGSVTSAATGTVQPENQALQGIVAINGTAKVGETLTANTDGISNGVGTATYQWKANGQDISGATSATYVLTSAEKDKTITLTVSYPGNTGSLTSAPTTAVQPEAPLKYVLDDKFPVIQDAGVSNAEMADAYAKLTVSYNYIISTLNNSTLFDGKLTEIHIFNSSEYNYTWNPVSKIFGINKNSPISYYDSKLTSIHDGSIDPYEPSAQVINHDAEAVRMAVAVPQDSLEQFAQAASQAIDVAIAKEIDLSQLTIYVNRQRGQKAL
jgi:hypothetical protein